MAKCHHWRLVGSFASNVRGNVAVLFSLASIPMLVSVGVAVDYARASNARVAMQTALDSASLMVAKEVATLSDVNARGQAIFDALYKNSDVAKVTVTTTYSKQTSSTPAKVVMSGSGTIQTAFMHIVGKTSMNIGSATTAAWANTRLRVALALDNTGSMAGAKMDNLKSAAKLFVTRLKNNVVDAEDLYISVVPFIKDVKIGNNADTSSYLDWAFWNADSDNQTCNSKGKNCVTKDQSTWTGCVRDRVESYDVKGDAASIAATRFSPDTYMYNGSDACTKLQQMVPLTNNFDTINTTIDNMVANAETNQPIGLFWAWWSLRQNNPYKDTWTRDPKYKYITAIVLFTDGVNTSSAKYSSAASINARQKLLCGAIKTDVLPDGTSPLIYAVQVDTDKAGQQQVLKDCVSGSDKYFFMTVPEQITGAFADIAASLSKLRIAQ